MMKNVETKGSNTGKIGIPLNEDKEILVELIGSEDKVGSCNKVWDGSNAGKLELKGVIKNSSSPSINSKAVLYRTGRFGSVGLYGFEGVVENQTKASFILLPDTELQIVTIISGGKAVDRHGVTLNAIEVNGLTLDVGREYSSIRREDSYLVFAPMLLGEAKTFEASLSSGGVEYTAELKTDYRGGIISAEFTKIAGMYIGDPHIICASMPVHGVGVDYTIGADYDGAPHSDTYDFGTKIWGSEVNQTINTAWPQQDNERIGISQISTNGKALLVFSEVYSGDAANSGMYSRVFSGGTWGSGTKISTRETRDISVSNNANNYGIVSYYDINSGGIYAQAKTTAWGSETLMRSGAQGNNLSYSSDDGSGFVFYESGSGDVVCKRWLGSSWGSQTTLSDSTTYGSTPMQYSRMGVNSSGQAFYVGINDFGATKYVQARTYNSGWSAITDLHTSGNIGSTELAASMNDSGWVVVMWREFDMFTYYQDFIYMKEWNGSSWTTTQQVSSVSDSPGSILGVNVDSSGDSVFIWRDTGSNEIRARRYVSGTFGTEVTINGGKSADEVYKIDPRSSTKTGCVWYNNTDTKFYGNFWDGSSWHGATSVSPAGSVGSASIFMAPNEGEISIAGLVTTGGSPQGFITPGKI